MTPERVEKIYETLIELVIELDPDPASRGPLYLQDLISRVRGYLNQASLLLHDVHRERHLLERRLDAAEAAFQVSHDDLLAEDVRVTRLPNIEDRKAMVSVLLREDRKVITDLKRQIKELGFVEKAVKHRHKELDSTISNIRMQKSLIDVDFRSGSFRGDETDTSRGSSYGRDDIAGDELDRLFGEALTKAEEAPAETPPLDVGEVVDQEPKNEEEQAIADFLDGCDDFSDLYAAL